MLTNHGAKVPLPEKVEEPAGRYPDGRWIYVVRISPTFADEITSPYKLTLNEIKERAKTLRPPPFRGF